MRQRVFELRNAVLRQFAAILAVSSLLVLVGLGGASAQSGTPAPDQNKAAAQPADAAAKDAACAPEIVAGSFSRRSGMIGDSYCWHCRAFPKGHVLMKSHALIRT